MLTATAYWNLYHFRQSLEPDGVYLHCLNETVVPWPIFSLQLGHESRVSFFAYVHFGNTL